MDREVAEELVNVWRSDARWYAKRLQRACLSAGVVVSSLEDLSYYLSGGEEVVFFTMPARRFMALYFHRASEALWSGAPDDKVIRYLCRVPARRYEPEMRRRLVERTPLDDRRRYVVHVRERDKKHDWKTVK